MRVSRRDAVASSLSAGGVMIHHPISPGLSVNAFVGLLRHDTLSPSRLGSIVGRVSKLYDPEGQDSAVPIRAFIATYSKYDPSGL